MKPRPRSRPPRAANTPAKQPTANTNMNTTPGALYLGYRPATLRLWSYGYGSELALAPAASGSGMGGCPLR